MEDQASGEFVKTLAGLSWALPTKAGKSDRIISEGPGLQEIEERHFELLIDGGMAKRYC